MPTLCTLNRNSVVLRFIVAARIDWPESVLTKTGRVLKMDEPKSSIYGLFVVINRFPVSLPYPLPDKDLRLIG